ncbi:MAG TPA: hypothetical protein VG055_29855 [Planctomycetaceae bacterium]|jgi:hypothetical protein|nr:hypothetical protein [Planctomycetaceae bacterium]
MGILERGVDEAAASHVESDRALNDTPRMSGRRWAVSVVVCAVLLALLACVSGSLRFGSMDTFAQLANGHELVIYFDPPDLTQPGVLRSDERGKRIVHVMITITNYAAGPRNVIGGTADCSCVVTGQLPQRIEPNGKTSIDATIKLGPGESVIDHVVTFYTDSRVDPVLTFRLVSHGH